ncbi:hypothetical protein [Acidipila sp. EB88]|uniref:hypothetical protein n=1 Tax=Acidipila sp. EB88 TaxID=2305226 RepID=UPI0013154786|nr:hypothetical protein [Acidipila sp. EB88]
MKQQQQSAGMTCEMAQRLIALAAMTGSDPQPASETATAWAGSPRSAESAHPEPYGDAHHEPFRETRLSAGFPEAGLSGSELSELTQLNKQLSDDALFCALLVDPTLAEPAPGSMPHPGEAAASYDLGALARPEGEALAAHLATCRSCQAELAATTAFFRALAHEAGPEPSATLLARSRMRLDASLDSCECSGFWARLSQQVSFTAGRLRAAPALSSAILLAGVIAGAYGGYKAGQSAHTAEEVRYLLAPPTPEVPSVVADVSAVARDPETGMVEIRYDRLVPDVLTAPADDPSIRELLMAATENGTDPQVRNASVNLLSGNCAGVTLCGTVPVRNALLNVLATDRTPRCGARRWPASSHLSRRTWKYAMRCWPR